MLLYENEKVLWSITGFVGRFAKFVLDILGQLASPAIYYSSFNRIAPIDGCHDVVDIQTSHHSRTLEDALANLIDFFATNGSDLGKMLCQDSF